jgi:hypothetical protein
MERWQIAEVGVWIIFTILSSIFYRMGGAGKSGQWYEDILDTKWRDIGVPLCVLMIVSCIGGYHWSMLLSAVLMFASMTTYWKKKGSSGKWYNWLLTGLFYGLSWTPYALYAHKYQGLALYVIMVSIGTMVWRELFSDDVVEECGVGAIVAFFSPLLVIMRG